ncbi:hypothetical protein OSH05_08200 [Kaistia algarum]|nr:hypothetical protein [Kaistia algarum]
MADTAGEVLALAPLPVTTIFGRTAEDSVSVPSAAVFAADPDWALAAVAERAEMRRMADPAIKIVL